MISKNTVHATEDFIPMPGQTRMPGEPRTPSIDDIASIAQSLPNAVDPHPTGDQIEDILYSFGVENKDLPSIDPGEHDDEPNVAGGIGEEAGEKWTVTQEAEALLEKAVERGWLNKDIAEYISENQEAVEELMAGGRPEELESSPIGELIDGAAKSILEYVRDSNDETLQEAQLAIRQVSGGGNIIATYYALRNLETKGQDYTKHKLRAVATGSLSMLIGSFHAQRLADWREGLISMTANSPKPVRVGAAVGGGLTVVGLTALTVDQSEKVEQAIQSSPVWGPVGVAALAGTVAITRSALNKVGSGFTSALRKQHIAMSPETKRFMNELKVQRATGEIDRKTYKKRKEEILAKEPVFGLRKDIGAEGNDFEPRAEFYGGTGTEVDMKELKKFSQRAFRLQAGYIKRIFDVDKSAVEERKRGKVRGAARLAVKGVGGALPLGGLGKSSLETGAEAVIDQTE